MTVLRFLPSAQAACLQLAVVLVAALSPLLCSQAAATESVPPMSRGDRLIAYRDGRLPLPGTPDLAKVDERLKAGGFQRGAPIYVRIFKQTSELEVWLGKGERFELFATYPICNWDGGLGPKLSEGDRQSPEGLYSVSIGQLRWFGRWHRGLDLGFPNAYDSSLDRTGSGILIHGGCTTVGCFAMTDTVVDEVFDLATAAMAKGQPRFAVHVFPFRMSEAALRAEDASLWRGFWSELKLAYDAFEATRVPPLAGACDGHYAVQTGEPGYDGRMPVVSVCPEATDAVVNRESSHPVPSWPVQALALQQAESAQAMSRMATLLAADKAGNIAALVGVPSRAGVFAPASNPARKALAAVGAARDQGRAIKLRCNPNLAACRHWIALRTQQAKPSKGADKAKRSKRTKSASASP